MTMKTTIAILLGTCLLLLGCDADTKNVDSCGDGFLDPGEECDKSELGGQTCLSLGHYIEGQLSCHSDCSFDTAECGGFCGDGILETDHGELCDLFELNDQTCQTMGFSGGALSCRADCSFNTEGCLSVCGDGRVEPDEGCDDGNREAGDGCDAFCLVEPGYACVGEPSECDAVCGDRLIAGDEACDSTTLSGLDCRSFGYYGGALGCASDCMNFDVSDCARYGTCGDGVLQGPHGEDCDGADLGGATCRSLGYSQASGGLLCMDYCLYDEALCVPESSNADLAILTVNVGVMVPAFTPDRTSYALTVPMTQASVTVSATAADPWAAVAFTPTQPIAPAVGANPVTVTVTAEDGTPKEYTVVIHRTNDVLSPHIGWLKHVPAGTFQRDATATNLSVVSAFRMSQFEITRAQWVDVTGWMDPSNGLYSSGTNDPVQQVSWYDAIAFCNKLSQLEGLTPVYSVSGVDFTTLAFEDIPTSDNATWNAATANWAANGYRLPTEMEWMWAAMGADTANPGEVNTTGYTKAFAGSTGSNVIDDYAWYTTNSGGKSHPAGSKLANELGFHDLSGNVWERTWDWHGTYNTGTLTDYRGLISGTSRVVRGGGWNNSESYSTVARRGYGGPYARDYYTSFRVVRP